MTEVKVLIISITFKLQSDPFHVHSRGATVQMSLWKIFYTEMCPDITRPNSYRFVLYNFITIN